MSNQIATTNASIFAITDQHRREARALKMMLPYGHMLTEDNALALLLYGKMHDLDPLNQECYFLVREYKDSQGNVTRREELGCYPGIKGKRKKAREQSHFKIEYTLADPKILGLNPSEVAVCTKGEMRDDKTTGDYIMNTLRLAQAGFSREEIERIIGKPPVVTGYGVVKNSEMGRTKMEPIKLARKRCENDCITQRFDLPLSDALPDDEAPEFIAQIEGASTSERIDAEEGSYEIAPAIPAPKKSERELMQGLGFDEPAPVEKPQAQPVEQPAPHQPMSYDAAYNRRTKNGTQFGSMDAATLEAVLAHPKSSEDDKAAATLLLEAIEAQDEAARAAANE